MQNKNDVLRPSPNQLATLTRLKRTADKKHPGLYEQLRDAQGVDATSTRGEVGKLIRTLATTLKTGAYQPRLPIQD